MTKAIQSVNAFVVKFANVNGSGSASANELFAKAILRMGVPVSPRNIFPSNIQGLPTWYEVRVSESGWLGRRGGVDLMVAMNPQTWDADVKELDPGGYLFYDSTKPLPKSKFRDDIHVVGLPLTEIVNQAYTDARQRQLFKNIIYVGALSALLNIDPLVIAELIGEQYKGKEALLKPNLNALQLGRTYALEHLACPLGIRVRPLKGEANSVGDKIFIEGNAAAALGCIYGGATVCAWYPITPSSSLAEAFQKYCSKLRVDKETGKNKFAIVQGEDELASVGIAIGAGWNGARAFTATSGPGISLMQEFIGLAYFAEIPVVIIDVQRGGPSTGMPTRTHPSKGGYFTRGTSKNAYAIYSEQGPDYKANMQRLLKKFETAKTLVPKPILSASKEPARFGAIYYGSTGPAMAEALDALSRQGIYVNALRLRSFPFQDEIFDFVASHSTAFVIEQNRDAQLKTLLVNDAGINPASLISVLHYDGTPITARYITAEIAEIVAALNVRPLVKKDKAA